MYEGGMRVVSLVRAPQLGLSPNTVNQNVVLFAQRWVYKFFIQFFSCDAFTFPENCFTLFCKAIQIQIRNGLTICRYFRNDLTTWPYVLLIFVFKILSAIDFNFHFIAKSGNDFPLVSSGMLFLLNQFGIQES